MNKRESVKRAICESLGIKNREAVEGKLDLLAVDMTKRKVVIKQMNYPGKKNIEELREKYQELTDRILKNIQEINLFI